MPDFKYLVEEIHDNENKKRINMDYQRFAVYNGQLKKLVEKAIREEFLLPQTVEELINRIVPINITQKIVDKLSTVYLEPPMRKSRNRNEDDDDLLNLYVNDMYFDKTMKHANRYFKLHKHTAIEPYVTRDGMPAARAMPSQNYTVFSFDPVEPEIPTLFVKHIRFDEDKIKEIHHVWTDNEFYIINGKGDVLIDKMTEINNPEGENPFGVIPFTYINSSDHMLMPIPDDDLITMQLAINLLLTDLAFASKYQAWSLIAIIGAENENLSFNPNSVINLPEGSSIQAIKPQLDSDQMLRLVEAYVGMLLTTKNLSVGTVTGQLQADRAASGVAKLIDRAETTEDRQDQLAFFDEAEKDFWFKMAHHIQPVWMDENRLMPEYSVPFSEDFNLSIQFPEIRAMLGEKERLELELTKLNNGLTTKRQALMNLNPELSEEEVDQMLTEVRLENLNEIQFMQRNTGGNEEA